MGHTKRRKRLLSAQDLCGVEHGDTKHCGLQVVAFPHETPETTTPEELAVVTNLMFTIDSLKVIEILLNDTKKRRGDRISRPLEWLLLMEVVAHCGPTFRILSILLARVVSKDILEPRDTGFKAIT
jgi:hypothetical protein